MILERQKIRVRFLWELLRRSELYRKEYSEVDPTDKTAVQAFKKRWSLNFFKDPDEDFREDIGMFVQNLDEALFDLPPNRGNHFISYRMQRKEKIDAMLDEEFQYIKENFGPGRMIVDIDLRENLEETLKEIKTRAEKYRERFHIEEDPLLRFQEREQVGYWPDYLKAFDLHRAGKLSKNTDNRTEAKQIEKVEAWIAFIERELREEEM